MSHLLVITIGCFPLAQAEPQTRIKTRNTFIEAEIECLARTIYHESRGEPLAGQMAVAWTALNRKKDANFPKTICSVIKQPNQFPWEKKGLKIRDWETYNANVRLAQTLFYRHTIEDVPKEIGQAKNALYFNVAPLAINLPKIKIGKHTFYIKLV